MSDMWILKKYTYPCTLKPYVYLRIVIEITHIHIIYLHECKTSTVDSGYKKADESYI